MPEELKENVDVVTDPAQSETTNARTEKNKYHIYEYFKEHTGFLIACVSATVAVISFVLNMAVYLQTNSYLNYWSVDITHISINTSNQIYYVLAAIIYAVAILFETSFISNTYSAYQPRKKYILYSNILTKKVNKRIKQRRKQITKTKVRLSKIYETNDNKNEIDSISKDISQFEAKLKSYQQSTDNARVSSKNLLHKSLPYLVFSYIICFFITFIGFLVLCLLSEPLSFKIILYAAIIAVAQTLSYMLMYGLINHILLAISINKKIESPELDIDSEIETKLPPFPLEKVINGGIKQFLSDSNLKKLPLSFLFILFFIIFLFTESGFSSAKHQTEFSIVEQDNTQYAVIYNNSEFLVLKKATIDGNKITIDLTEQKTISCQDTVLKKHKFNTVKTIDKKKEKSKSEKKQEINQTSETSKQGEADIKNKTVIEDETTQQTESAP